MRTLFLDLLLPGALFLGGLTLGWLIRNFLGRSKIEQVDDQLRLGQINQTLHDDLVRKHRESAKTVDELAEYIEVGKDEYEQIETGQSSIEKYGPLLLHYAEIIEQPVFNLFYPFGLPLEQLRVEDYH